MKQGTLITRIVMILLFIMVCVYMAAYAWRSLDQREYTVPTYSHTVDDAAEVTGILVRQEVVISGGGGAAIVDLVPDQGERVAAGQVVAYLYQDEEALSRRQEVRQLQLEREQLLYSLQQESTGTDAARLDQNIVDAMMGLKTSAAYGDLTGLEDQVLTFKSLVIRQDWSTTGGAQDISAMVESLDAQIQALQSAAALDTTSIRVSQSGVFSGETDGYESLLTPESLETMTASQLTSLMAQDPSAPTGTVGKLITSSTWYFAAVVSQETAERLTQGRTVPVRFSRDWSGELDMTVEQVGEPENGQCLVVLSSSRNLAETSLLRKQTVELVFDSVTGIRVPKKAVRTELRTTTDPETEEEVTTSVTGVYVLTGAQAEFKPVEILVDDGDYYLVQASLPQVASDNQIKRAFRAGDQVIISVDELYDGKVISG